MATQGDTGYTYSINLSVQEVEISTIPEPGTLALLMTASLALGVVSVRRRWAAYEAASFIPIVLEP